MPVYRVIIPAYTRVEEIHEIEANDEDEAKWLALEREPDEIIDDPDYYEPSKDDIIVTLHVDQDD